MNAFVAPLASAGVLRASWSLKTNLSRQSRLSSRSGGARPRACALSMGPLSDDPNAITEKSVLELLRSTDKGPQQRGLLLARRLEPEARLRALLFSVRFSSNEWIRATAAVGLGQLRGADARTRREAVDTLLALLAADGDFSIRSAAAAGCGYLADDASASDGALISEVVDSLMRGWFEDGEWQVKFSCLVSLGSLGDMRATPVLVEALKSDNDLIVQGAVGACGDLGAAAVVAPMLECLSSDDMMTRQRLAHALGCFPADAVEPAVVDALRTLADDASFAVRDAARQSLSRYGLAAPDEGTGREVAALLGGDADGRARTQRGAADATRRRLERAFEKESVPEVGLENGDGLDAE